MKERRTQKMRWLLALGLSLSFLTAQALADSSGLAQQTTASIVDNSTPQNNAGDGGNSREYNLGDAAAQSNTGSNVAALTGMSLVTAAIPMLASPLIPVKIAGATLMGEAGLEFAQAGADKGTQNQNQQGQQTLNNSQGDAASSSNNGSQDLASQIQQMLGNQNVPNAEGLSQALANGSLTNPSDVLKAMGDNTNYSAQDLAQGAQIAQQQAQSTVASNAPTDGSTTTPLTSGINYNPGAQSSGAGGGVMGGAGGMGGKSGAGNPSQDPTSDSALSSALASSAAGNLTPAAISQMQGTLAKQTGFLGSSFLANLLGNQAAGDPAHRAAANVATLRGMGIQKAIAGQNIFQLARHNYHSFDVWRKTAFLARN